MQEIILNAHIHTVYSDGLKTHHKIAKTAADCGLDAIVINDHNILPRGFDGYYNFGDKKVLLIVGEEIHDKNRQPQKNHLLAIGIDRSFTEFADHPQELIDAIKKAGGLTFIAHAHDPAMPEFGENDLSWEDWSVDGFTGIELWNNLSEFKIRGKNMLDAILFAFFPQFMALQPPIQIRNRWDEYLNKGCRISAIGGSDAHTLPYSLGPFQKNIFPYEYHFRGINNHILIENPLSGQAKEDTKCILSSLENGNLFIANDLVCPAKGFQFILKMNGNIYQQGTEISYRQGMRIETGLPAEADCVLYRNGEAVEKYNKCNFAAFPVEQPGVYRMECYRKYLFKKRGWIFTNPFYVR